jgi:hypothetical protein
MRPITETPEAQSNLTFLLQILHVSPALALDRVYAQFGDNRSRFFRLFVNIDISATSLEFAVGSPAPTL